MTDDELRALDSLSRIVEAQVATSMVTHNLHRDLPIMMRLIGHQAAELTRLRAIEEAAREYRDAESRIPISTLDDSMSTKTSKVYVYKGSAVDVRGTRSTLDTLLTQGVNGNVASKCD